MPRASGLGDKRLRLDATTSLPPVKITSGGSGTGNGTVNYTVSQG